MYGCTGLVSKHFSTTEIKYKNNIIDMAERIEEVDYAGMVRLLWSIHSHCRPRLEGQDFEEELVLHCTEVGVRQLPHVDPMGQHPLDRCGEQNAVACNRKRQLVVPSAARLRTWWYRDSKAKEVLELPKQLMRNE